VGVLIVIVMGGIAAYETRPKPASRPTPAPVAPQPAVPEPMAVPVEEAPAPIAAEPPPELEQLTPSQIKDAMKPTDAAARKCAEKVKASGLLRVKVTVEPTGKVKSVSAIGGELQKSKVTDCVVRATRRARFPRWNGVDLTFSYTFRL
jgi:hypothetical protein